MRILSLTFLLLASLAFVGTAGANDVGTHCVQFGDDHPGCGGGGEPPTPPGPGGDDGGNANTNTNTNTATATATAFGGEGGSAIQGQQQGQIGIVSGGDVSTSTSTSTSQEQSNSAVGSGNETNVDARDQSTINYDAQKRNPVSSAAPVFATACSRGASAQGVGMGGAIAFTNEICDLALAAELAGNAGDLELRDKLIERAGELAFARGNKLRVWLQWIPLIGQFM
jgi:hypothetical protein